MFYAKKLDSKQENAVSFVHIFRNELNALFGDDPDFTIYDIDEPLPDGTIDMRPNQHTLNIVCSNVAKLIIARDHIGTTFEDGEVLNIDYYYGEGGSVSVNPGFKMPNTSLDIKMLFEGNPHFSRFCTGFGQFGPWFCIVFKPELIQYFTEDAASLHGRRSCAMEDIARDVFRKTEDQIILFSTENIEDVR